MGTASSGQAGAEERPRRRRWLIDAAVLFGLAGVAITQPLLDLLGRNPPFFVAGRYEPSQIIWFAVIVAVVPATVVFGVTALAGLIHRRGAAVYHGVGVTLLAGLFVLVLCRTVRLDGVVYVVPVVALVAVAVALVEWRSKIARQFLAYLAVGNVAFVVLFLTTSPTARLIGADDDVAGQQGQVTVPPLDGPVDPHRARRVPGDGDHARRRQHHRHALPQPGSTGRREHLVPQRGERVPYHLRVHALDPHRGASGR